MANALDCCIRLADTSLDRSAVDLDLRSKKCVLGEPMGSRTAGAVGIRVAPIKDSRGRGVSSPPPSSGTLKGHPSRRNPMLACSQPGYFWFWTTSAAIGGGPNCRLLRAAAL